MIINRESDWNQVNMNYWLGSIDLELMLMDVVVNGD